jgi:Nucleoside 2-deoxyribosyltransferase like
MRQKSTIYLAGGMKSQWQDRVIAALAHEFAFKDPRSHGLSDEKAYTEWDLSGIRDSQFVLAYMDTDNPSGFGLSLEVGYAKGIGTCSILYVCEDTGARQKYFGMVRSCADFVFASLDDAINFLRRL